MVGHTADGGTEFDAFRRVETRGGLVEQKHGRLGDDRAGDADEAGCPLGDRRRENIKVGRQLELLDDLGHHLGVTLTTGPQQVGEVVGGLVTVGRDQQVVADGHLVEQLDGLPGAGHADTPPAFRGPAVC